MFGLSDLASDTQDPYAEWGQKAVSKSLFICLSYEFPFLVVHQAPHPLQCLQESGGDGSYHQCLKSFAGAGLPSALHGEQRRPLSPMKDWGSVGSNLQHPASKYLGPLALLSESSTFQCSLSHARVCSTLPDAGWHLLMLKHRVEGNGTACWDGGYPEYPLWCFSPFWTGEPLLGTSRWGRGMPAPCLHGHGALGLGGETSRRDILTANSCLGFGLGRGSPRVSCLSYSPFLCFIHMPSCLLGKISEQVGANTSFLCVGVTHALGPILGPFWIQWSHTHPCRQPGELVGPAQQGRWPGSWRDHVFH